MSRGPSAVRPGTSDYGLRTADFGHGVARKREGGYNSRDGGDNLEEHSMRLMNYSRSVGFGVVIALAAWTLTSASKAAAPATAATPATPGSSAQAPAPASPQAPLREPDVIYVPTPDYVVEAMLKMANVDRPDVVYDLGSGDGRIPDHRGAEVRRARRRHRHQSAAHQGSEREPGQGRRRRQGEVPEPGSLRDRPQRGDGHHAVPAAVAQPEADAEAEDELKPGTRIVSHSFDMGTAWPPEKTEDVNGRVIYYWTIK